MHWPACFGHVDRQVAAGGESVDQRLQFFEMANGRRGGALRAFREYIGMRGETVERAETAGAREGLDPAIVVTGEGAADDFRIRVLWPSRRRKRL